MKVLKIQKEVQTDLAVQDGERMILIVNDMKMPKKCVQCPFERWINTRMQKGRLYHDKICMAEHKKIESESRPNWCPLIEVYNKGECMH